MYFLMNIFFILNFIEGLGHTHAPTHWRLMRKTFTTQIEEYEKQYITFKNSLDFCLNQILSKQHLFVL